MTEPKRAISIFYSYAHEDEQLRNQLDAHLATMKRLNLIVGWHDRDIQAGTERERNIDEHLNTAQIVLLLVSAYFNASDSNFGLMERALERHRNGEAEVIPILLRSCDVEDAPFSHLQMLPSNGKAITSWPDLHDAFLDVEQGIRRVVQEYPSKTEQWYQEGRRSHKAGQYESALRAYNCVLRRDPTYIRALCHKGDILYYLKRHDEALSVYDDALHLDPNVARIQRNKGAILSHLRSEEHTSDSSHRL